MRLTGEINISGNDLHKEAKVAHNTNCFKAKQGQWIAIEIINHRYRTFSNDRLI